MGYQKELKFMKRFLSKYALTLEKDLIGPKEIKYQVLETNPQYPASWIMGYGDLKTWFSGFYYSKTDRMVDWKKHTR